MDLHRLVCLVAPDPGLGLAELSAAGTSLDMGVHFHRYLLVQLDAARASFDLCIDFHRNLLWFIGRSVMLPASLPI